MENPIAQINDYEARRLINNLVFFLGRKEVESRLVNYERSLKSSGPVFGDHYLKVRHPWWNALTHFYSLDKAGKSIQRHMTRELKLLVGDAKMIITLKKLMSDSGKKKYSRDLLDNERAFDYLFEIHTAWHFFLKGWEIQWNENSSSHHSEFLVKSPDLEFNVECKRISVDASKMIRRRDFYRLADKLIPAVNRLGFCGTIDISLNDKLHAGEKFLDDLCTEVVGLLNAGKMGGIYHISQGLISLEIQTAKGTAADLETMWRELWDKKPPQAHGVICAGSKSGRPIDPIEIVIKSLKPNNVLNGIRQKLEKAGKVQLDSSRAGLICCFLVGVSDSDLRQLSTNSGLQMISSQLLSRDDFSHIAAISYRSEGVVNEYLNMENYFSQGLFFNNPHCKFEKARHFVFGGGTSL